MSKEKTRKIGRDAGMVNLYQLRRQRDGQKLL